MTGMPWWMAASWMASSVGSFTRKDRLHRYCHTRELTFLFNGLLGPWERRTR